MASHDVQGAFGAIAGDVFGGAYPVVMATKRPALQQLYKNYFDTQRVEAVMFPTTLLAAPPMDAVNGSGKLSYTVDGLEKANQDTFGTCIRNTDPCTNAGIPSVSIPAGMTVSGLPVGMELDGPLGSDANLLAIGMAIEAVWGAPKAPNV